VGKTSSLVLTIILLAVFTSTGQAENWMYSPKRAIEVLNPQSNTSSGTLVFHLVGDSIATSTTCVNRFHISSDLVLYDEMVATIMLAYTLGKQVIVYYDDDSTGCTAPVRRVKSY
jgi:hypothetical protein